MSDFDGTPSFYTSEEAFEKYLGQTSYYRGLQRAVTALASELMPNSIIEFGSGTGNTTLALAEELPNAQIVGIDNRSSVTEISRSNAQKMGAENCRFETADMIEYVSEADSLPELAVMLYSFHHIPDPNERKISFLEDCYRALSTGGHVCIAETFIQMEPQSEAATRRVRTRWVNRGLEAYASTFWSALEGVEGDAIEHAQDVGEFARDHELEAGENVRTRDEEYLITRDWLETAATDVGFEVVLSEPVNAFGESVVLLGK
ncbi:class I SAM-dependent methyltransferase [Halocatena halophila]|uniref:class I SAM-dependent methyltransferase n=1 Tax=Halocatena halophila TaxID=2814576 RepID=UPI002ED637DF